MASHVASACMQIGLHLHPERGVDATFEEARLADQQGYDSMWLSDHLMGQTNPQSPDLPLDAFTQMAVLGAATRRIRLSWTVLNLAPHNPAVLAKMLSTLDRLTQGRVIAAVGSGWYYEELTAYNVPLIEDHDERSRYARELIELFRLVWSHPAPETVSYGGKYVQIRDLAFNPAPYQKPMPPIWMGGDSPATMSIVDDLADGWIPWSTFTGKHFKRARASGAWPSRMIAISRGTQIFVAETREAALQEARAAFEASRRARASRVEAPNHPVRDWPQTFDEFLDSEAVGDPDDCLERISEYASWGVTHLRVSFSTPRMQERTATLILPRLGEVAATA